MTLTEEATQYAAENAKAMAPTEVKLRRAYMAGALAVLQSEESREGLLAECRQYGRAIGTPAERATN